LSRWWFGRVCFFGAFRVFWSWFPLARLISFSLRLSLHYWHHIFIWYVRILHYLNDCGFRWKRFYLRWEVDSLGRYPRVLLLELVFIFRIDVIWWCKEVWHFCRYRKWQLNSLVNQINKLHSIFVAIRSDVWWPNCIDGRIHITVHWRYFWKVFHNWGYGWVTKK
jgi:hypothetical protein